MKKIIETKFSKIGTNPLKYFKNYLLHINEINIGQNFEINNLSILHEDVEIFKCSSSTTLRQNIDAWIWMGFLIKKDEKTLIKIINKMEDKKLIEHVKYTLLIESDESLINKHRNTILIKLLTIKNKETVVNNYSYEEIMKECGEFEKIISNDTKYIELIQRMWGKNEN